MKIALFIQKIKNKLTTVYYRRLIKEATGQDVSTLNISGKIQMRNCNVQFGKNVKLRGDVIFDGVGPIVIGDNCSINQGTIMLASKGGGITIGKNTAIAAYSYIIDMDHGTVAGSDFMTQPDKVKAITIGNNVWIAANCTILKGSKIGDNAVCAAKSVVTGKEISANAIVAGVPAKIIKYKA